MTLGKALVMQAWIGISNILGKEKKVRPSYGYNNGVVETDRFPVFTDQQASKRQQLIMMK